MPTRNLSAALRLIGRTKGAIQTKIHVIADADGRLSSIFMTAGQSSDHTGAAVLPDDLPEAQWQLGDRDGNADWFRDTPHARGIQHCTPGRKSHKEPIRYDKGRYRRRCRIEITFGHPKDWHRVATRYDRCPTIFLGVAIAGAAIFRLWT